MGELVTNRMRDLNHRATVPDGLLRSGCALVLVDEAADLIDKLRAENARLRAVVKLAVQRGLALEEAYNDAQRQYHNYQDWRDEQWDAIQAARDALCVVADTPSESNGEEQNK